MGKEKKGGENFTTVTEISGELITKHQLRRIGQRYSWAASKCADKDVLEVACGAGIGLGHLMKCSKSVKAGDITPELVGIANGYYQGRIEIIELDAEDLLFDDNSFDVVILFEAIYYLNNVDVFLNECKRVLRSNGAILIASANKDLYDFNPSPYSVNYYGVPELNILLEGAGFTTYFFGGDPVNANSISSRVLRIVKKYAVTFRLVPNSMRGKKWLKRLVYGKMISMPSEYVHSDLDDPAPIDKKRKNILHQVIYCMANIGDKIA